jgi:hypothetical protein
VKRNLRRFPSEFMFQLTKEEHQSLRFQIETLESDLLISKRGKHAKYLPHVFTEHGVAMLSSVLNSEKAIQMNIAIIKTFMIIRQFAMNYQTLEKKIIALEKKFDGNISDINTIIEYLLHPAEAEKKERTAIGFRK